jgi:hypothetical protein
MMSPSEKQKAMNRALAHIEKLRARAQAKDERDKKMGWTHIDLDYDHEPVLCRNCGKEDATHIFRCDECARILPPGTCGCGKCRMPSEFCPGHGGASTYCVTEVAP